MLGAGRVANRAKPDQLKRAIATLVVGMIMLVGAGVVAGLTLIDGSDQTVESLAEIVSAVAAESTEVTNKFLGEAEASGRMSARAVGAGNVSVGSPIIENTLGNVVASHPSIDGAFVGLPTGDFLLVSEREVGDGYRIRQITNDGGSRSVVEQYTDDNFAVLETVELVDDTYDPRERPWYSAALEQGRGWTDPYVFASGADPGITHFQSIRDDAGEVIAVVGIDMRLNELSQFLGARRPSAGGQAVIIADDGSIVAGTANAMFAVGELQRLAAQGLALEEGSAAVSSWSVGGELHVAAIARIGGDGQWTLAVTAPEGDFLRGLAMQTGRLRLLLPVVGLLIGVSVLTLGLSSWRRIDRLRKVAITDPLTGILNRNAIRDYLTEMLDDVRGSRLAAISIDLDDFGLVNERWGHAVGDAVLVEFTARLVQAVGDIGMVGRLGGDEFLVLLEVSPDADAVTAVTELAREVQAAPIVIGAAEIDVGMSCGIALREPGELIGVVPILRQSDLALLTAKGHKSKVVLFDPDMVLPSLRDAERSAELHRAIVGGEFEFYFQPEVDLPTGKVIGAEALMRWRQPDGSVTGADTFIVDMERLDLVDLLTVDLVDSCSKLAADIDEPGFTMRLNLSARQLRNHTTLELIRQAARRDSHVTWCIEITEHTIVQVDGLTLSKLEHLVADGVQLALDDFGTGYSSFTELTNLPITTIKIDRSFVEPLNTDSVNTSMALVIHQMGERLSLEVVAEGIETREQLDALSMIGCTNGQGWLFGKAVPMAEFLEASAVAGLVTV